MNRMQACVERYFEAAAGEQRFMCMHACMCLVEQVLLRQLHGNRDKWLKATLTKIAGDVAAVNLGSRFLTIGFYYSF